MYTTANQIFLRVKGSQLEGFFSKALDIFEKSVHQFTNKNSRSERVHERKKIQKKNEMMNCRYNFWPDPWNFDIEK
jgi:hypothetical protein